MDTLTIKIRNQKARKLIGELEALNLIQIALPATTSRKKLSRVIAGNITKRQVAAYHKDAQDLKNEWERNAY